MSNSTKQAWGGTLGKRDQLRLEKRTAILRMAARMFATEGYAGTSLASIADRLNVTKPTLYYYIENKEDILNACVEEGLSAVEANIAQAREQGSTALERLKVFFRLHVDFNSSDFGALLVSARQDLSRTYRRKLKAVDRAVIELLEQGVEDGSIKPCDTKMACFVLFGAFNSIPLWYREGGPASRDDVVAEYLRILFDGLAAT